MRRVIFKMAAISKQEYLKRYLSNPDGEKKKKKRKVHKTASKHPTSVIVDDDIAVRDIKIGNCAQEMNEFEGDADEAPAVYEEDGVTKISLEKFKKREEDQRTKWAPISQDSQSSFSRDVADRLNSNSNNSTPIMTSRDGQDTPDLSPRRSSKLLYNPDQSPPRRKQDRSPPRRSLRDSPSTRDRRRDVSSEGDQSPPRARRRRHDSGDSLPDQTRSRSPDLSPSRQARVQGGPDRSPKRRIRNDSPDLSPPRSGLKRDSDQSPPRKRTNSDSDQSPPRKRADSDSDQSPPRNRADRDSDESPPRKQNRSERGTGRRDGGKQRREDGPEERLASGRKAGLLSAKDLRIESEKKRQQEAEMFAKMDPSISGKGTETVYRDKMGRKKDIKMDRIKRREEERKEMEENAKFMEWGKGVAQTKQNQEKVADYLHEIDKPLARYRDDADLDKMLKEQERDDDPMLTYMKQKKAKQNIKEGKKEKPVYKGPDPPPNRFNIRPGYRWDGVDRSNGFERKRFAMLANKMATQTQAYKWSTEDM